MIGGWRNQLLVILPSWTRWIPLRRAVLRGSGLARRFPLRYTYMGTRWISIESHCVALHRWPMWYLSGCLRQIENKCGALGRATPPPSPFTHSSFESTTCRESEIKIKLRAGIMGSHAPRPNIYIQVGGPSYSLKIKRVEEWCGGRGGW